MVRRVEVIRRRAGGEVDLSQREELLAVGKASRAVPFLASLRTTPNNLYKDTT